MSTRSTRNSKPRNKELESSGVETKSNNKPLVKTTTTSNNKKKKEGKQKNKNNRGSGSNSDDEYNDHDSNKEYSDVKEKKKQQQQQQKKKRVSRSRTSSNNNNKKSITTNGSSGGGTAKQKRTRGTGSGGNLVEGASADAKSSVANNVETLEKSLDNLQVGLVSEVVEISGNNAKVTAKDDLAKEESKLERLKKELDEIKAKNKKVEAEIYSVS